MGAFVVVALAAVFTGLGLWQLNRLEERRMENAVGEARIKGDPVEFWDLIAEAGEDLTSMEYRRVTVTGLFNPDEEVLIRSQVHLGSAGFHVVTPLVADGGGVLVNRGWVPLIMDQTPVVDAEPPTRSVTIQGWVHLTQTRSGLSPEDADGVLTVFNRVDIDRIQQQVSSNLTPVYLVMIGDDASQIPVPLALPTFDDEGPHLAYAIQWFGFAAVGLIGFFFLVRRQGRSG